MKNIVYNLKHFQAKIFAEVKCWICSGKEARKLFEITYKFSFDIYKSITGKVKESEVSHLCPTLCDPMDCSLLGSSVHRIFQARVLEWVAIFFSRGSSWPRDWTQVSHIIGKCFTIWATREVTITGKGIGKYIFYDRHLKFLLKLILLWNFGIHHKLLHA